MEIVDRQHTVAAFGQLRSDAINCRKALDNSANVDRAHNKVGSSRSLITIAVMTLFYVFEGCIVVGCECHEIRSDSRGILKTTNNNGFDIERPSLRCEYKILHKSPGNQRLVSRAVTPTRLCILQRHHITLL